MDDPFQPDWMRMVDLPWCRIVAVRGRYFILRFHAGPFTVFVSSEALLLGIGKRTVQLWALEI